ncbi:hypothetical protein [uncultured Dokdonia sp.]|nr:hypothetical protein [uncultured Dokdonia sp.]
MLEKLRRQEIQKLQTIYGGNDIIIEDHVILKEDIVIEDNVL